MSAAAINALKLLVAEFFYFGRFPVAPGTAGSLGSLAIWIPSLYFAWSSCTKMILLLGIFFLGIWASGFAIKWYGNSDPKQVVIDEVVGQGIPFLIIDLAFADIIASFLLFRFFDILKPWPIRNVERSFPDRWGIMIDDVIAGLFAMVTVALAKKYIFF